MLDDTTSTYRSLSWVSTVASGPAIVFCKGCKASGYVVTPYPTKEGGVFVQVVRKGTEHIKDAVVVDVDFCIESSWSKDEQGETLKHERLLVSVAALWQGAPLVHATTCQIMRSVDESVVSLCLRLLKDINYCIYDIVRARAYDDYASLTDGEIESLIYDCYCERALQWEPPREDYVVEFAITLGDLVSSSVERVAVDSNRSVGKAISGPLKTLTYVVLP